MGGLYPGGFSALPGSLHRESSYNQLDEAFSKSMVVMIQGISGVGKTTLANEYFSREMQAEKIPADFCFTFRFIRGKGMEELCDALENWIVRKRGEQRNSRLSRPNPLERLKNLVHTLSGCKYLILLDNLECLKSSDCVFLVEYLKNNLKNTKCILISRQRLKLSHIQKADSVEIQLSSFSEEESHALLRKTLGKTFDKIDKATLKLIYQKTRGLPLGLKLLGGMILNDELGDLKDRMQEFDCQISAGILDKSLVHFTPEEKEYIEILVMFEEDLEETDLEALWTYQESFKLIKKKLLDHFIIEKNHHSTYRMDPVIKEFVSSRISEINSNRYREIAADYLYTRGKEKNNPQWIVNAFEHYERIRKYNKLSEILPDAAEEYLNRGHYLDLLKKIQVIKSNFLEEPPEVAYYEGVTLIRIHEYKKAVEAFQKISQNESLLSARGLRESAMAYWYCGKQEEALHSIKISIAMFKNLKSPKDLMDAIYWRASFYKECGDFPKARKLFYFCLQQAKKSDDLRGVSRNLNALAVIFKNIGQVHKAINYFQQNIDVQKKLGDWFWLGVSMTNLVSLYIGQGNFSKAKDLNNEAIQLRTKINDLLGQAVAYNNAAIIFRETGEIAKAIRFFHRSRRIKEQISDKKGVSYTFNDLGILYRDLGNYKKSTEYLRKAIEIKREIQDRYGLVVSLRALGTIYKDIGRYTKARELFMEAVSLATQMKLRNEEAILYHQLGSLHVCTSELEQAINKFNRAVSLNEELGNRQELLKSLGGLAGIYSLKRNYGYALQLAEKALKISREVGSSRNIAISANLLARIFLNMGKMDSALKFFKESLDLRNKIGDERGIVESYISIAKVYRKNKKNEEGLKYLHKALYLCEKNHFENSTVIVNIFIGEIYLDSKRIEEARSSLLETFRKTKTMDFQEGRAFCCKVLGRLYQIEKNYERSQFYIEEAIGIYEKLNKLDFIDELKKELENLYDENLNLLLEKKGEIEDKEAVSKMEKRILDRFSKKVTLLLTDIVGYTSHTEDAGLVATLQMLQEHDKKVTPIITECGGDVIKKMGDAILARFEYADSAVFAGLMIRKALDELNEGREKSDHIKLKLCINSGKIIEKDNDIFGDTVNVLARMEKLGKEGTILLSEETYQLIDPAIIKCEDVGEFLFKGKKKPIRVYQVDM